MIDDYLFSIFVLKKITVNRTIITPERLDMFFFGKGFGLHIFQQVIFKIWIHVLLLRQDECMNFLDLVQKDLLHYIDTEKKSALPEHANHLVLEYQF